MTITTTSLGGTAPDITVGKVAVRMMHPNFNHSLSSSLSAWVNVDDVRVLSITRTIGHVNMIHVDGEPSRSQKNSASKPSRLAWMLFLPVQRCSSTEGGSKRPIYHQYVLTSGYRGILWAQFINCQHRDDRSVLR